MKNQTTIYLTDSDKQKLEKIKEVYDVDKMGEAIKIAINAEYTNIVKYQTLKI